MTDVTGYGLLGHLCEMAAAGAVRMQVSAAAVPVIDGVTELLDGEDPPVAGGTRRNRAWIEPQVSWSAQVPESRRWLLCDAMTSGGLLVAGPPGANLPGTRIGVVQDAPKANGSDGGARVSVTG
jgi:selenide,water dikinase